MFSLGMVCAIPFNSANRLFALLTCFKIAFVSIS